MTIKLLTPRDLTIGGRTVTYPAGALVTLDTATETGLINSKEATATLTGGITYTPPVPSGQPVPLTVIPSDQGIGNGAPAPKLSSVGNRAVRGRPDVSAPAVIFGGESMSLSEVTALSGSPVLEIVRGANGMMALDVTVPTAGGNVQIAFARAIGNSFGGDVYMALEGGFETGLKNIQHYASPMPLSGGNFQQPYLLQGALDFSELLNPNSYLQPGGAFTWRSGVKNAGATPPGGITYPFCVQAHKFVINARPGVTAKIRIYLAGFGRSKKGTMCLMADDGEHTAVGAMAQMCAYYGIPMTAMLIESGLGTSYADDTKWRAFLNAGNCIGSHGPNYGSYAGNLFTEFGTTAARVDDMESCRRGLDRRGLLIPGAEMIYAWPQGASQSAPFDTSLYDAAFDAGFTTIRGSSVVSLNNVQYNIAAATRRQRQNLAYTTHLWSTDSATHAANIAAFQAAPQIAGQYGTTIFPTCHIIVPDSTPDGSMTATRIRYSDLKLFLENAAAERDAGRLECVTLADLALRGQNNIWAAV